MGVGLPAHRTLLRRALTTAVVVVAVSVPAAGCGDGGDGDGAGGSVAAERAAQVRQAAADAGLPADVVDLLAQAAGAVGATYRVTYEVSEGHGDGGEMAAETVTVTADPPRRRVDTVETGGGGARAFVTGPDGSVACVRQAGAWTCERGEGDGTAGPGAFDADSLRATIERLAAARSTHRLAVERRRLAGADASCLVAEPRDEAGGDGAPGTFCIAPNGVPLLIERSAGTVRATAFTTTVDPDQLAPPDAGD